MSIRFLFSKKTYTRCSWAAIESDKYFYETTVNGDRWNIAWNADFRSRRFVYVLYVNDQVQYGFNYWPSKYWGRQPQDHLQRILDTPLGKD